jgi:ATP-dependent helicase/nuclease subunit B
MRKHVRKLYEESGNRIISGATEISPYKLKDRTPCQFCSFRSVCQFDQSLEENDYRVLQASKPQDLLNKLREEDNTND